jgi:hypothetical protein
MVGHLKDFRWRPTLGSKLICRGFGRSTDLDAYVKHWKSIMRVGTENCEYGHSCGDLLQYNLPTILCLSNSSVISDSLQATKDAFMPLFRRKAMIHHYSEYCGIEVFEEASLSLELLKEEYQSIK